MTVPSDVPAVPWVDGTPRRTAWRQPAAGGCVHVRPRHRILDLGSADIGGIHYRAVDDADHHRGARDHAGND